LLQTKKELESKRMAEMGNLREATGIIPRLPFEKQPTPSLNAWVSLQVLDQRVLVLDALKGFSDYWARARYKVAGLLSEKETLDYVRGRLKDKKSLPIRIDIYYKPETNRAAEDLRQRIILLARETHAEMDTEVRLERVTWVGSGESTFFLREGKIRTLYPDPVQRPDGGPKLLVMGLVDPNDLEQCILWRLTKPKNVPLTFRIEYDEASTKLAKQIADTAKAVAKRVGLAELVSVTGALVEPVPETVFLGRWQAITQGEMQTIDVQPRGICQVTMGKGTQAIKAGANVSGMWLPTTKEIFVDINDKVGGKPHYVYRGYVNAEGDLVFERGDIYPQGSFYPEGAPQMIFKKVQ
jgi:hypothetical protein